LKTDQLDKRANKKAKSEKKKKKDKKQPKNTEKKVKDDINQVDESDGAYIDQKIEDMYPYANINPIMKEAGYRRFGMRYVDEDEDIENTAINKPAINLAVIGKIITLIQKRVRETDFSCRPSSIG
jgi:hypothetical protein